MAADGGYTAIGTARTVGNRTMSAIRMMAVFARRVGMMPQAVYDHWRYPHGSLGQGIRIIKRYVQSHQVDVDFLDADQNRYEVIAEVWFDSDERKRPRLNSSH